MNARRPHPTHELRFSDAPSYDYVCKKCGNTDMVPGGWGRLIKPCPGPKKRS